MTDQNEIKNEVKKPLTLSGKLNLKNPIIDRGTRSAGNHKTVIVEVKKTRSHGDQPIIVQEDSTIRASKPGFNTFTRPVARPAVPVEKPKEVSTPVSKNLEKLTVQEKEARFKALEDASKFVEQKALQLDESSRRSLEMRMLAEKEAQQKLDLIKAELAANTIELLSNSSETNNDITSGLVSNDSLKMIGTQDPENKFKSSTPQKFKDQPASKVPSPSFTEDGKYFDSKNVMALKKPTQNPRNQGKINIHQINIGDEEVDEFGAPRARSLSSIKRAREKERLKAQRHQMKAEKIIRDTVIPETITVQELSNRMSETCSTVIKCFMKMGMMVTITQSIDGDTAQLVAEELGHRVKRVSDSDVEDILIEEVTGEEVLVFRAPVVTIMGHVDHGKTSLLDALRTTDVVSKEAGGITQHIGAYQVTVASGKKITFIDTPGHAAFTEMRARGANATDIVVLVVAADDGIKDQTVEAINHAKAAGVPIIVAINKIDKPGADIEKVKNALLQHEIYLETLGGDTLSVEVSAKEKTNLDKLEEVILLQAEIMDLKANIMRSAMGVVIEARLEKGLGPVATTLIPKGTLKNGEFFVAGAHWGKVRALIDVHGKPIKSAGPSVPVEIIGFNGLPEAGDIFTVVAAESKAREIAEYRQRKQRERNVVKYDKTKMESIFAQNDNKKELFVLIKGDVQGSVEAISSSLLKMKNEEVSVKILHAGVGGINESDITLAKASKALIVGFNVRANTQARELASRENIDIRYYSIIYDVVDDAKALLSGLLSPTIKENFIGRAEIRKVFKVTGSGIVAGCYVTEGMVKRGSKVRLLRDNIVIHEGSLKTLKRMKDEVKEVKSGFECGMAFENYDDIREKDIIECSETESVQRTF